MSFELSWSVQYFFTVFAKKWLSQARQSEYLEFPVKLQTYQQCVFFLNPNLFVTFDALAHSFRKEITQMYIYKGKLASWLVIVRSRDIKVKEVVPDQEIYRRQKLLLGSFCIVQILIQQSQTTMLLMASKVASIPMPSKIVHILLSVFDG